MKRFFEIEEANENEKSIMIFSDSEIETEYNVYGCYYKDENYDQNLKSYKEERATYVKESLEYDNSQSIRKILKEFEEEFQYDDSKNVCRNGRPSRFVIFEDEDNVDDISGFYNDSEGVYENDGECYYEYYSYHDGSNFRKIYLSGDGADNFVEEITEDVSESFENKKFIGDDKPPTNYTGWFNYYFDQKNKKMWIERISLYQGELTDWLIVDNEEEIAKYFVMYGKDMIDELYPEMREKYGNNLIIIESAATDYYSEKETAVWEIASLDNMEEIGNWINDVYRRTHGSTYYKYKGRIIVYSWSAYQNDRSTYSESDMSYDEVIDFINN